MEKYLNSCLLTMCCFTEIERRRVQQLLDLTAAQGGWPVAGITMQLKDKKPVGVRLVVKPIDANANYTVAGADFVANGGENANMLRSVPQMTTVTW